MNFYILTLFPDMISQGLSHSILKRAQDSKLINIECTDIRAFTDNKHGHVDDAPYGGGAGMVMQAQPIYDAWKSVKNVLPDNTRVVYMTPQGRVFNQELAKELSQEENLIILCGHYEGVDERVIEEIVTDEISIGDFVLTGGELGAMVIVDSISRLIPGVLGKKESFQDESFTNNLLEYPQYTRPVEFMGREVPEVLLSGHHANIEKWRHQQSLIRTYKKRPELLEKAELTNKDKRFLEELKEDLE